MTYIIIKGSGSKSGRRQMKECYLDRGINAMERDGFRRDEIHIGINELTTGLHPDERREIVDKFVDRSNK